MTLLGKDCYIGFNVRARARDIYKLSKLFERVFISPVIRLRRFTSADKIFGVERLRDYCCNLKEHWLGSSFTSLRLRASVTRAAADTVFETAV